MNRKTKIIATLGPASNTNSQIKKLILAGMNVARLNMSHGDHGTHAELIKNIREISDHLARPVAIMLDLQGPKIRTGNLFKGNPVELKKNQKFSITTKSIIGNSESVSTSYLKLPKDVKKHDILLIDDGLIELQVEKKTADTIICTVLVGGILKEHKGINLPHVSVSAASLTSKDQKDVLFGIEHGIDYFALSFVRSAQDCIRLKKILVKHSASIPLIAKIEKPEAYAHIDSILSEVEGIMVARGDLGVEMNIAQVPSIQKTLITKALYSNKIVITATQMLESMCKNPIPTRAEASDVANAIFDGTDAVMLSAETASGLYPVKTVETMVQIAEFAEQSCFMHYNLKFEKDPSDLISHAVAQSAVNILHEINACAIVNFSWSGKTAKLISKQRPAHPVYVFTPQEKNYNAMACIWGITPFLIKEYKSSSDLITAAEAFLIKKGLIKKDQLVVIVSGMALISGSTNFIKLHRVGKID